MKKTLFFIFLLVFCAVLIIGVTGCGDDEDENEWAGTWIVESVDAHDTS